MSDFDIEMLAALGFILLLAAVWWVLERDRKYFKSVPEAERDPAIIQKRQKLQAMAGLFILFGLGGTVAVVMEWNKNWNIRRVVIKGSDSAGHVAYTEGDSSGSIAIKSVVGLTGLTCLGFAAYYLRRGFMMDIRLPGTNQPSTIPHLLPAKASPEQGPSR
jgi:hypothetical protein